MFAVTHTGRSRGSFLTVAPDAPPPHRAGRRGIQTDLIDGTGLNRRDDMKRNNKTVGRPRGRGGRDPRDLDEPTPVEPAEADDAGDEEPDEEPRADEPEPEADDHSGADDALGLYL